MNITVRKVGNSKGVVFPREVLQQAAVDEGDHLTVTVVDGKIILERCDDEFQQQLELADRFMDKYKTALKKLAE